MRKRQDRETSEEEKATYLIAGEPTLGGGDILSKRIGEVRVRDSESDSRAILKNRIASESARTLTTPF